LQIPDLMAEVNRLAQFAWRLRYEDLSRREVEALKVRLADSCAVAIAAVSEDVPKAIYRFVEMSGPGEGSHLIGDWSASPSLAAFYNSALVRYLDFNDSILTPGETFHPSDVVGGLLAFGDFVKAQGRELLTAMALSYQIQTSLSEAAPVRAKGFDHTLQLGYAAAAALAKILGLPEEAIANAIAIAGTVNDPLRVTRTGKISHWKGLAAPFTVFTAANAALLAKEGITGPSEIFEGNKGFKDVIAGGFSIDWEAVEPSAASRSIVKRFNAEIHSQSALELTLSLRQEHKISAREIERVAVQIFDVAYHIIGGGEEGRKSFVSTKEEADHSLPYLIAVALLDGEVGPAQFLPARIASADVQELLRKVQISPSEALSRRFPGEMPVEIRITLRDGRVLSDQGRDYEGFTTRPMDLRGLEKKFNSLTARILGVEKREALWDLLERIDEVEVRDLMRELTF
jgi:2-methylcitrate dehydratase